MGVRRRRFVISTGGGALCRRSGETRSFRFRPQHAGVHQPPSHHGFIGPRPPADLRRCVGVDAIPIHWLPRLSSSARRSRRVQRQIHVVADGPPRRFLRYARNAHPRHLPKLLPTIDPLAIQRPPPGTRRSQLIHPVISTEARSAQWRDRSISLLPLPVPPLCSTSPSSWLNETPQSQQ